jgi:Tol biopolymer transport system component
MSFSADGSRMTYLHQTFARNVMHLKFDAKEARLDDRQTPITRGTHYLRDLNISPDGAWLTYSQDDKIMVVRADGIAPRQLTEGAHSDRGPRWSPDGQRIAFYSNRSGVLQLWSIGRDGSGLQQITNQAKTEGLYYPVFAPDGRTLFSSSLEGKSFTVDLSKPALAALPELPRLADNGGGFVAWSWSPDGARLAGWEQRKDGTVAGVVIYDPTSKRFTRLTDFGNYPAWIDDRRLLFSGHNQLNVVEIESRRTRALQTPAGFDEEFALSHDGRSVYYTESQREGDVWLIKISGEDARRQ